MNRWKRASVLVVASGALLLGACGGSDSESSDTSVATEDSVAAEETPAVDDVEAFCAAAADAEAMADIADDADAAAIAEAMATQATRLGELASIAPAALKGDVDTLAKAADDMAKALAADPALENFDAVVESYATEEINTASTNVEAYLSENCGATE